jgi:hypothetical protein
MTAYDAKSRKIIQTFGDPGEPVAACSVLLSIFQLIFGYCIPAIESTK